MRGYTELGVGLEAATMIKNDFIFFVSYHPAIVSYKFPLVIRKSFSDKFVTVAKVFGKTFVYLCFSYHRGRQRLKGSMPNSLGVTHKVVGWSVRLKPLSCKAEDNDLCDCNT